MADERDTDTGRFTEQYPREAFLTAIDDLEVPTTSHIAEAVGCSYDLAYRRLHTLADDDLIVKTDVGGSFVWDRA